ncbi:raftlin-like isoform X2 [Gymnodraco acuticeps]|uniref:Raftlin-like isoform X2 n=1 Tax=Gymnodraco acuticeps TaxID=8218 RepID=A0A6P8TSV9_GYMAC|nr:raftlin-like isoform X2 [Gymnodraco acuticeps]
MGCGLRKMKPMSEENSPGKIYSTLKRPQVETKVGVAYTYRYLDFLIGGTSTLRLSSVRELPGQLQELYQQGFVLASVHPFIHPCGPESNSPQHQLYRAILIRLNDGVERSQPVCPPYKLQLEECLSAEQVPTPELIQGYVKKQIHDAADQGVMFVGFVQEPYGAPCTRIREPDTPSLSLHSSPSSVLGSLGSCSPSNPSSPRNHAAPGAQADKEGNEEAPCEDGEAATSGEKIQSENTGNHSGSGVEGSQGEVSSVASPVSEGDVEHSEELTEEESPCHNNNKDGGGEAKERLRYRQRRGDGVELLALYNHPPIREGQVKYYTVKVPLRVQNCDEGVKGVEANWLDHMTQHFNNGASLVDGYFHLGNTNDMLPKSVESVFIFQEACESDPNSTTPTFDAIVVEQWTVINGLQVKADYVPLLQSLATYGWRLTCVLPTPVIKTNSDGSLSTKQIVFLQRPVLSRKRRESKKLIFKPRSKSNKNCIKETAKNKKKKKTKTEKDAEDPKILDDKENVEKEENNSREEAVNATDVEAARESETSKEREVRSEADKMIDGIEISIETFEKKDGGAETEDKEGQNVTEEEEEEKIALDGEGSNEKGEPLEKREVQEVTEIVATVETQSETKEKVDESVAEVVIENGVETDEEKDEGQEIVMKHKTEEPAGVDVIAKEIVADSKATPTNQSSEETPE